MDTRTRKIFITAGIVFVVAVVAMVVYALIPKNPSTQDSDKTVIIKNYSKYTDHISADSFGYLGNYLYKYIKDPKKGVYNATIVDGSYTYSKDSWFSRFVVKLEDSDISWKVSMQTLDDGSINADIGITCVSGSACLTTSSGVQNVVAKLQASLPITNDDYIISYQLGTENTLSIVYYDQEGTGKTKALDKIKSLGFKPEDYTIEYYYGGH